MATAQTQMLNVRDTARRLGVHENTVRNWADRGVLRPVRLPHSGYRRFDPDEVERLAREMRSAIAPLDEHHRLPRPDRGRAVPRNNQSRGR